MMNRGIQSARILHVERFECIVESRGFKRKSRIGGGEKKRKGREREGRERASVFCGGAPKVQEKSSFVFITFFLIRFSV